MAPIALELGAYCYISPYFDENPPDLYLHLIVPAPISGHAAKSSGYILTTILTLTNPNAYETKLFGVLHLMNLDGAVNGVFTALDTGRLQFFMPAAILLYPQAPI